MITHVQIAANGKTTYRKAIPAGAVVITDLPTEIQA
jgi:outer membrane usher protein FimD/PapC